MGLGWRVEVCSCSRDSPVGGSCLEGVYDNWDNLETRAPVNADATKERARGWGIWGYSEETEKSKEIL